MSNQKTSWVWFKRLMDWLFMPTEKQISFVKYVAIFFVLMVAILSIDFNGVSVNVTVGNAAEESIVAPKSFTFIDVEKTRELRRQEMEKVQPIYVPISSGNTSVQERFAKYFDLLKQFHLEYTKLADNQSPDALIASYPELEMLLDKESLQLLKSFKKENFDILKSECVIVLSKYDDRLVAAENINAVRDEALAQIEQSSISDYGNIKRLMGFVIKDSIRINAKIEKEQTEKKRREAAFTVQPVKHTYNKGQNIVTKGETVTQEAADTLKKLSENISESKYLSALGYVFVSLLYIVILLVFLRVEKRSLLGNINQYKLIGVLILFSLVIFKAIYLVNSNIQDFISIMFSPLPTTALLFIMLLDSTISIFNVLFLGLVFLIVAGASYKFIVISIMSSIVGILACRSINQGTVDRKTANRAGYIVGLVNAIGVFGIMLIDSESLDLFNYAQMKDVFLNVAIAAVNGVLSGVIAVGVMPMLEGSFSLPTIPRLNELASPTHPLLKKLAEEAPGTYQHSMAVATLAEAAADAIHADPLLTKISAYYHDIGKTNRPKYFVENLAKGEENPHNSITPNMSALILMGHVRDGVDIGRDAELPETVLSIMSQHHGTTLVRYFYAEAKKLYGDSVSEERFRYPGPKPQTKEAAVLMLADSIEAAARTLPEHSYAKVEDLVNSIIDLKHSEEKQLEESDITLTEIKTIKEVFIKTIISMYHGRIEYPDAKKEQSNENSDQQ